MKASDQFPPRAIVADAATYLERGFAKGKPVGATEPRGSTENHHKIRLQPGTASGLRRQTARFSVAAVATQTA